MIGLLVVIYTFQWLDGLTLAITAAALVWLAVATRTALVVGPLLRRDRHAAAIGTTTIALSPAKAAELRDSLTAALAEPEETPNGH